MWILAKFWREGAILALAGVCFVSIQNGCATKKLAKEYERQLGETKNELAICQTDLAVVRRSLVDAKAKRDEFKRKYEELLAQPPKVVTRVRTVTKRIPGEIVSTGCDEATEEALPILIDLAKAWEVQ